RKGYLVIAKIAHQPHQLILCVFPKAAPPVAQRPTRQQGHGAGYPEIVLQRTLVIAPIAKEVQVERLPVPAPDRQPATLIEKQAARVVDDDPAAAREQAGV